MIDKKNSLEKLIESGMALRAKELGSYKLNGSSGKISVTDLEVKLKK